MENSKTSKKEGRNNQLKNPLPDIKKTNGKNVLSRKRTSIFKSVVSKIEVLIFMKTE